MASGGLVCKKEGLGMTRKRTHSIIIENIYGCELSYIEGASWDIQFICRHE